MGREGKVGSKRNLFKRVRSKDNASDDSDEDYVAENEENASDDDSEDYGNSIDGYASEEGFDGFIEEEEEEEEFRKVGRLKKNKGYAKNRKFDGKTSRKRKKPSYEDEEDEDYVDDEDYNDDDDEEFAPDEDEDEDCLYDDEESTVKKKNNDAKVGKKRTKKMGSRRSRKRRRKSKVSHKPATKRRTTVRRLKKKERLECGDEDDGDFVDSDLDVREKSKKNHSSRRRYAIYSDSDCVSAGSSDYDYTISEEEREQMKEANKLCGDLKTSLRSSTSIKKIEENGDLCHQTKPSVKKGKEKVKEANPEVGKQVCGVCLSEEDKRRLRGTLDCCSHYFCFTCIMEWSKVESRCPLCKQRFTTITKNGRSTTGVDLRNMVIQVPKRDQVYQPSEEEIRSFIDPYENVICTECHEGGDDGLMLLCDLCDSPAHTYCVGLGHQVPEGNWYCDGCRPVALGSSSSQAQDIFPDQRPIGNNMLDRSRPSINLEEAPDTILESSPRMVFAQGLGNLLSPRLSSADVQTTSPVSGAGAPTLSVRRQIHRHIQNLITNRINFMAGRTDFNSASNVPVDFPNSQIDQGNAVIQIPRTTDMGILQHTFLESRLQDDDHPSSSIQSRDFSSFRASQLRRQMVQNPSVMTPDRPANLTLWPGITGVNSIPGYEQFNQRNGRSSTGLDGDLPPYIVRERSQFYAVKEQLQSMVKSHLKGLSQDFALGNDALKDIARRSTHTILAACGLDHKTDAVAFVPQPSSCNHVDRVANGQASIMKGLCSSCFDSLVRDVVKRIMEMRDSEWLSLGL